MKTLLEKFASLLSMGLLSETSLIRIRACEDGVLGICHAYKPVPAGVLATIVCQAEVGEVFNSSFTLATLLAVHVMFRVVPNVQFSPPFGAVSAIACVLLVGTM